MIEVIDREATEASTVPGETVEAKLAQKPVTQKITVEWQNGHGVVNVSFDSSEFKTWSLVVKALEMAKDHVEHIWAQSRIVAEADMERQAREAAKLQAKLAHEQNNNQQRRR